MRGVTKVAHAKKVIGYGTCMSAFLIRIKKELLQQSATEKKNTSNANKSIIGVYVVSFGSFGLFQ